MPTGISTVNAHAEFIIMTFLVFFQIFMHRMMSRVEDDLVEEMKTIMRALLEEVTGLGFVAVIGFTIIETGLLQYLSQIVFNNAEHLVHMFESLHFLLFSVMLCYLISVMFTVYRYKKYTHELHLAEVLVSSKKGVPVLLKGSQILRNPHSVCKNLDKKRFRETLRYLKIRERFILTRLVDPNSWFAEEMDETFDFSEYLCANLAALIEALIHIPIASYSVVVALFVLKYIAQLLGANAIQYSIFYMAGGPVVLGVCFLIERHLVGIVHQLTSVLPALATTTTKKKMFAVPEDEEIREVQWFNDQIKDPPYVKGINQGDPYEMATAHGDLFWRRKPELYLTATRCVMLSSAGNISLICLKFGALFGIYPVIPFVCLVPHIFILGWFPFRLLNLLMMASNVETSKNPRSVRKTIQIMKTKKIIRMLQLLDSLSFVHKSVKKKRKMTVKDKLTNNEDPNLSKHLQSLYDADSSDDDHEENPTERETRADRVIRKNGAFDPKRNSLIPQLMIKVKANKATEAPPDSPSLKATDGTASLSGKPQKNNLFVAADVYPINSARQRRQSLTVPADFNQKNKKDQKKVESTKVRKQTKAELVRMGSVLVGQAPTKGESWFDKLVEGGLQETREVTFRQAFRLFDKDDSGSIDPEELHAVMNDLGFHWTMSDIEMAFAEYDEDGTRTIEFQEFRDMLLCREKEMASSGIHPSAASVIRGLFNVFDTDQSGEVTIREFHDLMKKLDDKLEENQVLEFIREIDLNGDGVIDLFEFAVMLRKYWVVNDGRGMLTNADMAKFKSNMGYSGSTTGMQQLRRLSNTANQASQVIQGRMSSVIVARRSEWIRSLQEEREKVTRAEESPTPGEQSKKSSLSGISPATPEATPFLIRKSSQVVPSAMP